MLGPGGGIVTPGDLNVTQQSTPNMSVLIGTGQIWVPGTSTPSQGMYYSRNGAAVTVSIAASNPSLPRIDTVICQVEDLAYAGASKLFQAAVVTGTATSGATLANLSGKGTLPVSSLPIAYVLVPANATSIITADISNVIAQATNAFGQVNSGWQPLSLFGTIPWSGAGSYLPQARLTGDTVTIRGQVTNSTGAIIVANTQIASTPSSAFGPATSVTVPAAVSGGGSTSGGYAIVQTTGQIWTGVNIQIGGVIQFMGSYQVI